jgi:hypothetical protein
MFQSAESLDAMGGLLEIDLDVVPPRLHQQSDYNASWNMRTLIMMARAKMLELESRPPGMIARGEDETEAAFDLHNEEHWARYFRQTVVRMIEMGHRNNLVFDQRIADERERSYNAASVNRGLLDELLSGKVEVSSVLDRLYRSHAPRRTLIVSPACGGCPIHRKMGTVDLAYREPLAYGIENVTPCDTSLFRERFEHLNVAGPVILPLAEPVDTAEIMTILEDLVATFGIREVAVSEIFRAGTPDLGHLHRRAGDGIMLIQSLEEEASCPPSYRIARATVVSGGVAPWHIFLLGRPLHIILAPISTPDPLHRGRRLADTGTNILTVDQFKLGART